MNKEGLAALGLRVPFVEALIWAFSPASSAYSTSSLSERDNHGALDLQYSQDPLHDSPSAQASQTNLRHVAGQSLPNDRKKYLADE